jgi:hypothetical protein
MGSKVGKDCKVALGTGQVLGIGNWSIDGRTRAEIDDTEFGDEYTSYLLGVIDGGTIGFAGNFKPDDTTGQVALEEAFDADTEITNLRLYIDNTSYYEPCRTTGWLHPGKTTGARTTLSSVRITSEPKTVDKGGLIQVSFTARVNGSMVLV